MLKKITKWETEDGKVFDTQEDAEDYMFEQEKEVMTDTTEQERANVLHALEESQSLLAAMLHEARPAVEIQKQMLQNRDAIEAARRAPAEQPEALRELNARIAHAKHLGHDQMACYVKDLEAVAKFAAAPQPPEAAPVELPEPALYVSGGQLEKHCDPEDTISGSYIPARKTAAGLFTASLYTEQQVIDLLKSVGVSVKL
jgi:hypothetical protein